MLLNQYFETQDPQEITQWSDLQEQELLTLKSNAIEMKDTAIAISTKQMVNTICNSINLLNIPKKTRLIQTLNQEEIWINLVRTEVQRGIKVFRQFGVLASWLIPEPC